MGLRTLRGAHFHPNHPKMPKMPKIAQKSPFFTIFPKIECFPKFSKFRTFLSKKYLIYEHNTYRLGRAYAQLAACEVGSPRLKYFWRYCNFSAKNRLFCENPVRFCVYIYTPPKPPFFKFQNAITFFLEGVRRNPLVGFLP